MFIRFINMLYLSGSLLMFIVGRGCLMVIKVYLGLGRLSVEYFFIFFI